MADSLGKRLGIMEKLKKEQKELTSMLDDALNSNDEYREAKGERARLTKDLAVVKAQILNEPKNAELFAKLKDARKELAEEKEILGQELAIYFSKEGKNEIELPSGQKFRFRLTAVVSERID